MSRVKEGVLRLNRRGPILGSAVRSAVAGSLLLTPLVSTAGWVNGVDPGSIRVVASSGDVTFAPRNFNIASACAANDFWIIKSAANARMVLAVLLTAKSTGKLVNVHLDGRCDATGGGRPTVSEVMLVD
ncbi:hypothetical protein EZ313_22075 [Ramlibacter henchirensis]|uniref:Uncharacterized protein n=1 Tax=Ramlibacter henchirensis TaxID=204072 RepID=A0A4Z0BIU7_9BURK|nr:hypothetical protein [Ramlibacter henchirensis]TFY99255.1 hypothetical protein EZ313_22075 [Ramlibacter henchirensis]